MADIAAYMKAFAEATIETFEKMVKTPASLITDEAEAKTARKSEDKQEVVARMAFNCDFKGTLLLVMPITSARAIASAFSRQDAGSAAGDISDEDLHNSAAEIVNIIGGRAMESVNSELEPILQLPSAQVQDRVAKLVWKLNTVEIQRLTFSCELGNFEIGAALSELREDEPASESDSPVSGNGLRIMLVDDSPIQRRLQKSILTKYGITDFIEAGDGLEAIQKIQEVIPDVILLDWNMPGMDGIALAKKLLAHEDLKKVPIIMVTSEADKRKVLEALKAGIRNYIVKPFKDEALWGKIEKVLKKAK